MSPPRPISIPTFNVTEMDDLGQKKRIQLVPDPSPQDVLVSLPSKKRGDDEEAKVFPIVVTSQVDDYPDGGLAAWSVVFGVGPSANSSLLDICYSRHPLM